jgi:DNA-binding response OmpR family regulator
MNTILLLDYDPHSIGRIRSVLAARNCHLEVCRDGRTALEVFRRLRPTLTLVQDLLPGGHGFEICRELKRSTEGLERPVALLVGARPGRERDLPDTGCDGWLFKPFDDAALLELVGRWIDVQPPHRRARPRNESEPARDRLLQRTVVRTEVPVPVELSESDIMGTLDAILGNLSTAAAPAAASKTAGPRRSARRGKRSTGSTAGTTRKTRKARSKKSSSAAEPAKAAAPTKTKARRKTAAKRRKRPAAAAAAG